MDYRKSRCRRQNGLIDVFYFSYRVKKTMWNSLQSTNRKDYMNKIIENNFTYHAPKGDQSERYILIRETAKNLAYIIDSDCPNSREKSLAMTKLEECVMWANASIARNE